MKVHLYLDYISQPARTVLAFCKISNIPIEITEVRVAKLQVRPSPLSISPNSIKKSTL